MKPIIGLLFSLIFLTLLSCEEPESAPSKPYRDSLVSVSGAMKNVMKRGELGATIHLDTLNHKIGLYGVGPLAYLRGEIMIYNGDCYISRVTEDSMMKVVSSHEASAPFFVYSRVQEWDSFPMPNTIQNTRQLENYIDSLSKARSRPFAFRMEGRVEQAQIHVQNLPKGSSVSSPEEAHRGQVKYKLEQEKVFITGFFSTQHQGIFTHHDSYLHMHLLTADKQKMGHLDQAEWGRMQLYLPKQ
jgi:acetolactate decarboxylase